MLSPVHWLGHSSLVFTGETVWYLDPYEIKKGDPADVILITHDHFDHLSPAVLARLQTNETEIVIPEGCDVSAAKVHKVRPGDAIEVQGVSIRVVPAYNTVKTFHPKSKGYAGYIIQWGEFTYYHAGDTDFIPEMEDLQVDVAFLPVGGTYTMNADEAARAALAVKAKLAVPIHWGSIVGAAADAARFKELCTCPVQIMERG